MLAPARLVDCRVLPTRGDQIRTGTWGAALAALAVLLVGEAVQAAKRPARRGGQSECVKFCREAFEDNRDQQACREDSRNGGTSLCGACRQDATNLCPSGPPRCCAQGSTCCGTTCCGAGTNCCPSQNSCVTCGTGEVFNPATCECECAAGTELCGGACVTSCPTGQVLDPTTCECGCPGGSELCDGECLTLCGSGEVRNPTTCECECTTGNELCGGLCRPVCPTGSLRDPLTCECSARLCTEGTLTCGGFEGCGGQPLSACLCGESSEGAAACVENSSCLLPRCNSTAECPLGDVCVVNTCCQFTGGVCLSPCGPATLLRQQRVTGPRPAGNTR